MIIVTSNLTEQDWEKVYGVYLLAETDMFIPWYVKKWGLDYYSPPSFLPTQEGVYGVPLSPALHKMRVCMHGERWMESLAPSTYDMLLSVENSVNMVRSIGSTQMDDRSLLNIFGIRF